MRVLIQECSFLCSNLVGNENIEEIFIAIYRRMNFRSYRLILLVEFYKHFLNKYGIDNI